MSKYSIYPAIGFARVGNSPDGFYLEPTEIAGLPTEINGETVTDFKKAGQMKRQAARFQVYREDGNNPPVVVKPGSGLKSLRWTVHVANKKAAWYNFQELQGDTMLGKDNTYEKQGVPLRNAKITGEEERRKLIIDPGPRTVTEPGQSYELDLDPNYQFSSFPPDNTVPYPVTTLGQIRMHADHSLLVLGGYGNAGGPPGSTIDSFAGADGYYDDVSDGSVTAEIELDDGTKHTLFAWVVTAAPKLAPELRNISSLADIQIDVGVRYKKKVPDLFKDGKFNPDYKAVLERDVLPVVQAMKEYRWAANVDAMVSFATPPFDFADLSHSNEENRKRWFSLLRNPGQGKAPELSPEHQQYFAQKIDGKDQDPYDFPLMPQNSGDNSISNVYIEKFMALTPTQYFLLGQWARGKCISVDHNPLHDWSEWVNPLNYAASGNAVGEPMAPGIEVTWSTRNPIIYDENDPFRVKVEPLLGAPLSPGRDETSGGGCQPGDLTKRLAIPWQADFFDCSIQEVNFTTPTVNKTVSNATAIPLAPTVFAYWWPAQSPYNVYEGARTASKQALDGNGSQVFAQNVLYHRGINSFNDTIIAWKYLGFVLNLTKGKHRKDYPFFVELERNYEAFQSGSMGLDSNGRLFTTQPSDTTTYADVDEKSQNTFPVQWLVGN